MPLSFAIDSFDLSTGGAGTTQARTGYLMTPKVVLGFHGQVSSASSFAGAGTSLLSFGSCTAAITAQCASSKIMDTSGSSTGASSAVNTEFLRTYNTTAGSSSIVQGWELSSFDADGVTYRVSTGGGSGYGAPSSNTFAIGGSGLVDVQMGNFSLQDPAAVSTISGLRFAPDGVIFYSNADGGGMSLGAACRFGSHASATSTALGGSGSSPRNQSYSREGECIAYVRSGAPGLLRGQLTSWTPDGFQVTCLDSTLPGSRTIYFTAFKMAPGFGCQIFRGNTQTSTGSFSINAGGNQFQPLAGLLVSGCGAESSAGVIGANAQLGLGIFIVNPSTGAMFGGGCYSLYATDFSSADTSTVYYPRTSGNIWARMSSGNVQDGVMALTSTAKDNLTLNMIFGSSSQAMFWGIAFGQVPYTKGAPLFF